MERTLFFRHAALLCVLMLTAVAAARAADTGTLLDAGYNAMYNLDFERAHQVFAEWETLHPDDPMGPTSDAAAYLFAEFDRLHVLELDLFADDRRFEGRATPLPNPQLKQAFEARLARARQLAGAALAHNPRDTNALFAQTLCFGLQGDYVAMVEKRELAGLSYMKQGRAKAEKLVASDPGCYDAYLAIGVENYLLSLKPAPVRWFLRLGGAETDKAEGLEKLRLTATRGHYLLPYARLLLAVAALRDNDREGARSLLDGLAREYPHNRLYREELARLR
jgi:hypothetical protein